MIPNLLWIIPLNRADSEFYKLIGRTPWNGMAEHPSKYMAKQSRPESDHQLQEPSHMKSDGVDAWLQHWLKLQKRNKHPLILKDNSDKIPSNPTSSSKQKRKAKAFTPQSTDDNTSDEEPAEVLTMAMKNPPMGLTMTMRNPLMTMGKPLREVTMTMINPTLITMGITLPTCTHYHRSVHQKRGSLVVNSLPCCPRMRIIRVCC